MDYAFKYIETAPLMLEADYPYTGKHSFLSKCEYDTSKGVGKVKADAGNSIPDYNTGPRMTSDKVAGNGTRKDATQYTGNYIIGIGQMHKSNGVPITRKEDAVAIANMRR